MSSRIVQYIACIISVLALASTAHPAEMYRWIDKNGTVHISEMPPDEPVKLLGKDTYRDRTPEERRRDESKQRLEENQKNLQRRANESAAAEEKIRSEYQKSIKKRELERERENLADAEKDVKYYQDRTRDSRYQSNVNYYEQQKRQKETEVINLKKKISDLEKE